MSGIAALKGYRTQFLYSLHYILSHQSEEYTFRLEGNEDLDVFDKSGNILFAIQVKNLQSTVVLSDILESKKTSFLKRFIENYFAAVPVLVSFGQISSELKAIKDKQNTIDQKEKRLLQKFKLSENQWKNIKAKIEFEEVNEEKLVDEILKYLKEYSIIDPVPTAENILYWLQLSAERQISITTAELFNKIEEIAAYLSERISVANQYGLIIKALHKIELGSVDVERLKEEFYYGSSARYEHILFGLDVERKDFTNQIQQLFKKANVVIVQGASGQGKSTLIYRYACDHTPASLIYELNLVEESIIVSQSILAITAITKKLNTPVLFIINVSPNTTQWLKIVKEFAHYKSLMFLVAIRQDDWFRAISMGIDFLYNNLELSLSREEASSIYDKLDQRKQIVKYADFDEAWIKFGGEVPLLEFVYSITQGDSLKNKLKQQILQLVEEDKRNVDSQVELLRLISLADFFGAKIDISKIGDSSSIRFAIDKFEKEFLIKKSADGYFISGLHPVRSEIITDILFDEFVIYRKKYALKCLSFIVDEDVFTFLLKCLYKNIVSVAEIIKQTSCLTKISWTFYNNLLQAFIWAGTRDFVECNRNLFDECYSRYGDAWYMMADVYHGNTFDVPSFLASMPFPPEAKLYAEEMNSKLSNKQSVYSFASMLFNTIELPSDAPTNESDWRSFGEALFWLRQIPNNAKEIDSVSEAHYENAFKNIGLEKLSKLMLGMYYYSDDCNNIRIKLYHHFISRVKEHFKIPLLKVDTEIQANFIVDVLEDQQKSSLNDMAMRIVDLLRNAFPDMEQFNVQGYGHKMRILPLPHDNTVKRIPIKNLPLEEWVTINALTKKLYEFSKRPVDWLDFHHRLQEWETQMAALIFEFNEVFEMYFRNPSTLKPLVPLLKNADFSYSVLIPEPQSISDSFGIYFNSRKQVDTTDNETSAQLKNKYNDFFKIYRDFKIALEHFILQSGSTLLSKAVKITNPEIQHDDKFERLSQINFFDAIEKLSSYNTQKKLQFKKFSNGNRFSITQDTLFTSAVLWKDFLNGNHTRNENANRSDRRIYLLKQDFESRIIRLCKAFSKVKDEEVTYLNNNSTSFKPVLMINSPDPLTSFILLGKVYNAVKEAVDSPEYTSLKQLMLQTWFSEFYVIPLSHHLTVNNKWFEFHLHSLRDESFEKLVVFNSVASPINTDIVKNLGLKSWSELIPKIDEVQKCLESFIKMRLLVEHLEDIRHFNNINLDVDGIKLTKQHVLKVGPEIQRSFQLVLDFLAELSTTFEFDEKKIETDEFEQDYWRVFFEIKENIFPTNKGDEEDYEVTINLDFIGEWSERLSTCTNSWGIFVLLVFGKYIRQYESSILGK